MVRNKQNSGKRSFRFPFSRALSSWRSLVLFGSNFALRSEAFTDHWTRFGKVHCLPQAWRSAFETAQTVALDCPLGFQFPSAAGQFSPPDRRVCEFGFRVFC